MQSITFAYPTLTTAQMTRQDQIDVSVNQATAAIVCCYLEHMNTAINKDLGTASTADSAFITFAELTTLVNNVQGALRVVT